MLRLNCLTTKIMDMDKTSLGGLVMQLPGHDILYVQCAFLSAKSCS